MPAYSTDCERRRCWFRFAKVLRHALRSSPRKRRPGPSTLIFRRKTGSPLPRGGTESVARPEFTYSVVKQLRALRRVNELHAGKRKSSPVCCSGPGGRPHSASSVSLEIEGDGAPQGAWPGFRQTGPGARDSRAGPDRRALGVKRHAPRLAARQRGILAFRPLTVVGPGRLVVADEAARARPGDEGCVRPSHAGAAPVPRLQNASGRRPSKLGSGWPKHSYA